MWLHFNETERHEEAKMDETLKSTVAGLGLLNMAGVDREREKTNTMTGRVLFHVVSCNYTDLCWTCSHA